MTDSSRVAAAPLIRNLDYCRLVGTQALSILARETGALVLPLLVLAMTNSPAKVGLVAALQSVPYLLLSLPAGALVDRWSRKRVMFVCDSVRALVLASLPLGWWLWGLAFAHLAAVALITGIAFVFYNIAELACLPLLVPKAQLPQAMTVNVVTEWSGALIAPALAGFLVGQGRTNIIGAMHAYVVQCALIAVSLIALAGMRTPLKAATGMASAGNLVRETREGLSWLVRQKTVRALALLSMALNVVFSPIELSLIVRMRNDFHSSAQAIGLFFAVCSTVGLVATLASPWLRRTVPVGRIIVGAPVLWGIGLVIQASSGSIWPLGAAWMLVLCVGGLAEASGTSYRLTLIPAEMQGRVNSVFRFIAWGVRPVMLAIGGASVGAFGTRTILWLLAAGMIGIAGAAVLSPLRKLK